MGFTVADRVKETSVTDGLGDLDLDGAVAAFQSFVAGIGDGNTTVALITDGTDWEISIVQVNSGTPNSISRQTVLESSNGGSKVNWAGGATKTIACVLPSIGRIPTIDVYSDDAGASENPLLTLTRDSASPVAADKLGELLFYGNDSGGSLVAYAAIIAEIEDPTTGASDGEFGFWVRQNDALAKFLTINPTTGGTIDDDFTVNGDFTVTGSITGGNQILTGTIIPYAKQGIPSGYLACQGANVSRTTYADLFAVIGTTWGVGDGSTTFTLPDLRRRTLVGDGGAGTGTLGNSVGDVGGEETHTLSVSEMPGHSHPGSFFVARANSLSIGSAGKPQDSDNSSGSNVNVNVSVATQGGGSPHNNMQPSAVIRYLIKT